MRISSVNGLAHYNCHSAAANSRSFGGLWGKTSVETDVDEVMCTPVVYETRYYYPFKDEKQQDIDRTIQERKSVDIIDNDGFPLCVTYDCKPGMRLPFSRQQYEAYMRLRERPHDYNIELIHQAVKNKYVNDAAGSRQRPAYNRIIDKQKIPRLLD